MKYSKYQLNKKLLNNATLLKVILIKCITCHYLTERNWQVDLRHLPKHWL